MTRAPRETPHLFAEWGGVTRLIRKNKHLVVFLDFDGTLVRIAPMPDAVRLEKKTRDILEKLSRRRNVTLAVISGRQRAELQQYIGIRNVTYMGLYGWESSANKNISYSSSRGVGSYTGPIGGGPFQLSWRVDRAEAEQLLRPSERRNQ
jgi:hypothetical protein